MLHLPSFHSPKKGFTFIELLLTTVILSVGLTALVRVFFGVANGLDLVRNRFSAFLLLEEKTWEAKKYLAEHSIVDDYRQEASDGDDPKFITDTFIKNITAFTNLYDILVATHWQQRNKEAFLQRELYVRKNIDE